MAPLPKIELRVTLEEAKRGLRLMPGHAYKIIVVRPTVTVDVVEAEDALFRTDSAVFLPCLLEDEKEDDPYQPFETPKDKGLAEQTKVEGLAVLSGVLRFCRASRRSGQIKQLLVTGHTDSVGSNEYNEKLSLKRAQATVYLLLGGPESRSRYVSIVNSQHVPQDVQHLLKWTAQTLRQIDLDPGTVDGKLGPRSQAAIRAFKRLLRSDSFPPPRYKNVTFSPDFDDLRRTLTNSDETFAANAWAAAFELMQAELQHRLQEDKLSLVDLRAALAWIDDEKKAVGCGETWPLEARGQDNYKSQTNRRVEILLYDPQELKDPLPCKQGPCVHKDCHIFRDINVYGKSGKGELKPKLEWKYLSFDDDGHLEGQIQLLVCNYALEPLCNKSYVLKFEGMEEIRSTTTDEGLVIADAPAPGTLGRLEVLLGSDQSQESIVWEVEAGAVPSSQEPLGASIRLRNLSCSFQSPTTGLNDDLRESLESFQYNCESQDISGELDDDTCQRLKGAHDELA